MSRPASQAIHGPLSLLLAAEVARWYEDATPYLAGWLINRHYATAETLDDVLQDMWVQVIRYAPKIAGIRERADRRNYLYGIARNVVRERYRKLTTGRAHVYDPDRANVLHPLPLGALDIDDAEHVRAAPLTASAHWIAENAPEQTTAVRMSLRAVWDATPHEFRELLLLLMDDYTMREMATRLGIPEGTVATRIWRLRGILRAAREQMEA